MTIKENQLEIISEFEMFGDWMEKYNYLIELGKELKGFDEKHRTEQNIINGCQSQVWLQAELIDGKIIFTADSDAIITKGIVALLIRTLSDHTPDDVFNADMAYLDEIGLKEHLSPTRANGLLSMIKQMKLYALAYKSKMNQ